MKPIILAVILAIFALIFWPENLPRPFNFNQSANPTTTPTPSFTLPESWSLKSEKPVLKYEKESDQAVKPGISFLESNLPPEEDFEIYINKMIRGARSGMPGISFSSDQKDSKENLKSRILEGSYYQGKSKVNFIQRIFLKENKIYVLTASYSPADTVKDQINNIFDHLISTKIGL